MSSSSNVIKLEALQKQLSQIIYDVGEIQRKLAGIIASIQVETIQKNNVENECLDESSHFQPSF
jgi:hypothetical protein